MHSTTQMSHPCMMLSGRRPTWKAAHCMTPLIWHSWTDRTTETKAAPVVAWVTVKGGLDSMGSSILGPWHCFGSRWQWWLHDSALLQICRAVPLQSEFYLLYIDLWRALHDLVLFLEEIPTRVDFMFFTLIRTAPLGLALPFSGRISLSPYPLYWGQDTNFLVKCSNGLCFHCGHGASLLLLMSHYLRWGAHQDCCTPVLRVAFGYSPMAPHLPAYAFCRTPGPSPVLPRHLLGDHSRATLERW